MVGAGFQLTGDNLATSAGVAVMAADVNPTPDRPSLTHNPANYHRCNLKSDIL